MKKKVAIVMGGYSTEKDISINSGNAVYKYLDREKYDTYRVFILKERWFALIDDTQYHIDKSDFSIVINGANIHFDCIFNAIHGTPGEDGKLQAYLELLNIPYTSCDSFSSALTFTKKECLAVLAPYEFNIAKSAYIFKDRPYNIDKILDKVGLPAFVKPNRGGSSFGISKVYQKQDFIPALEKAFTEDNQLLIEEFIKGREVSVGVGFVQGTLKAFHITEIITQNDFFDYNAKYHGESQEITPADLPAETTQRIQTEAIRLYECLNLKGFVRIDFIIKDQILFILEVNTVPGLSKHSIVPKQLKSMGINLKDFFTEAVDKALE